MLWFWNVEWEDRISSVVHLYETGVLGMLAYLLSLGSIIIGVSAETYGNIPIAHYFYLIGIVHAIVWGNK